MDPKLPETEVGMILDLGPPEIQGLGTLSESQGTKILVSKILVSRDSLRVPGASIFEGGASRISPNSISGYFGPYDMPVLVAWLGDPENPKLFRAWCG